jgi:hypothetical protein
MRCFQSTGESVAAVNQIESIGGEDAKKALFQIAGRETSIPGLSVQLAAIRALRSYGGQDTSEFLASLLSTDSEIDVRLTAAESLSTIGCDQKCADFAFAYLNTIYEGRPNREDTLEKIDDPELMASVTALEVRKQQKTYKLLNGIILQNEYDANKILAEKFGLGTGSPAGFSIDFVERSQDRAACSLLKESSEKHKGMTKDDDDTQKKLTNAMMALKC